MASPELGLAGAAGPVPKGTVDSEWLASCVPADR